MNLALRSTGGALLWPEERLLVAADLHLEKGSSYASSAGRLLPPYDSAQTVARLERLVETHRPRRVIALGDSFHDRGGANRLDDAVAARIRRLTDLTDWIWIVGNHDPKPPSHLGGRGAAELAIGPLIFRHDAHRGPARRGRRGDRPLSSGRHHRHARAQLPPALLRDRRATPAAAGLRRLCGRPQRARGGDPRLLEPEARLALLGRDRLHLFPLAATLPDATLPVSVSGE